MNKNQMTKAKKELIAIGRLLWEKNLATGLNGNLSVRVDKTSVLITGHNSCLGLLKDKDFSLLNLEGRLISGVEPSSEKSMHVAIYKNFPEIDAVAHTHPTYANGYFSVNSVLTPTTFETKLYLGSVKAIAQATPKVTDLAPVMALLKENNVIALQNHGVVAIGKTLFDCFLLTQGLEEAVQVDVVRRLYSSSGIREGASAVKKTNEAPVKKYQLFSDEQIEEIVRLVNEDAQMKSLGEKTQMNMDLAVKLNESGRTFSFSFQNGRITKVGHDENAEFLISAPESVWRAVFNREIDPFVATTQKKMNLRGDFGKISRWYAPCSRIFELWQMVPVE